MRTFVCKIDSNRTIHFPEEFSVADGDAVLIRYMHRGIPGCRMFLSEEEFHAFVAARRSTSNEINRSMERFLLVSAELIPVYDNTLTLPPGIYRYIGCRTLKIEPCEDGFLMLAHIPQKEHEPHNE